MANKLINKWVWLLGAANATQARVRAALRSWLVVAAVVLPLGACLDPVVKLGSPKGALSTLHNVIDGSVTQVTAGQAMVAGTLALGDTMAAEMVPALAAAGLNQQQIDIISTSARNEVKNGTLSISTTSLLLADAAPSSPVELAAPAVIKGAVEVLGRPDMQLSDAGRRASLIQTIIGSGFKSLSGRTSELKSGGMQNLASSMVGGAVSVLSGAGLADGNAGLATQAITEASVGGLKAAGVPASDVMAVAKSVVSTTVNKLSDLHLPAAAIASAVGGAAKGAVASITSSGLDAKESIAAVGALTSATVSSMKNLMTDQSSWATAMKSVSSGAVAALKDAHLADAAALGPAVKSITSSMLTAMDQGGAGGADLTKSASAVVAGAMSGLAQAADDNVAAGAAGSVISGTMESLSHAEHMDQSAKSAAVSGVVSDAVAGLAMFDAADLKKQVLDTMIATTMDSFTAMGITSAKDASVTMKAMTANATSALDDAGFDASVMKEASQTLVHAAIHGLDNFTFDSSSGLKDLMASVVEGVSSGMQEMAKSPAMGGIDASMVAQVINSSSKYAASDLADMVAADNNAGGGHFQISAADLSDIQKSTVATGVESASSAADAVGKAANIPPPTLHPMNGTMTLMVGQVLDGGKDSDVDSSVTDCAVTPDLPAGMVLLPNCHFSGSPTAESPMTAYTLTPFGAGGSGDPVTINIAVMKDMGGMYPPGGYAGGPTSSSTSTYMGPPPYDPNYNGGYGYNSSTYTSTSTAYQTTTPGVSCGVIGSTVDFNGLMQLTMDPVNPSNFFCDLSGGGSCPAPASNLNYNTIASTSTQAISGGVRCKYQIYNPPCARTIGTTDGVSDSQIASNSSNPMGDAQCSLLGSVACPTPGGAAYTVAAQYESYAQLTFCRYRRQYPSCGTISSQITATVVAQMVRSSNSNQLVCDMGATYTSFNGYEPALAGSGLPAPQVWSDAAGYRLSIQPNTTSCASLGLSSTMDEPGLHVMAPLDQGTGGYCDVMPGGSCPALDATTATMFTLTATTLPGQLPTRCIYAMNLPACSGNVLTSSSLSTMAAIGRGNRRAYACDNGATACPSLDSSLYSGPAVAANGLMNIGASAHNRCTVQVDAPLCSDSVASSMNGTIDATTNLAQTTGGVWSCDVPHGTSCPALGSTMSSYSGSTSPGIFVNAIDRCYVRPTLPICETLGISTINASNASTAVTAMVGESWAPGSYYGTTPVACEAAQAGYCPVLDHATLGNSMASYYTSLPSGGVRCEYAQFASIGSFSANVSSSGGSTPSISWTTARGADSYDVVISSTADCLTPLTLANGHTTVYSNLTNTYASGLDALPNGSYFACVKANSLAGLSSVFASNNPLPFTIDVHLMSLTISPSSPMIGAGQSQQISVSGYYSDFTMKPYTGAVTWSVTDANIATVDASGVATGVARGQTTITATSGAMTASSSLTVTAPMLTIAGTYWPNSGNGAAATSARLYFPESILLDGAGHLYISDSGNSVVRVVDLSTGHVSAVAGTGEMGYAGDGALAVSAATLASPRGLALDGAGNLYIADTYNNRIRKVTLSTGIITTVAGGGYSGLGDGGLATSAQLSGPSAVAFDASGNLLIADSNNNRIRKVTMSTGVISTIAGTGSASYGGDGGSAVAAALNMPRGVAVDGSGNIYIADTGNGRIRKVDSSGAIATVAGGAACCSIGDGAAATAAYLNYPTRVAVNTAGDLFIADHDNARIRKVGVNGIISTIAGNGMMGFSGDGAAASSAEFSNPTDMAVDANGDLYIADTSNNRIRVVSASNGNVTTMAGSGAFSGIGGAAAAANLSSPRGVAKDGAGYIYFADSDLNAVFKINGAGILSVVAGMPGSFGYGGDGGLATNALLGSPQGVAVDSNGDLFIADSANQVVRKVSSATGYISTYAGIAGQMGYSGDGSAPNGANLNAPMGLAFDMGGNLYIADSGNNAIRRISGSTISTFKGTGLSSPTSVAVDLNGNVFIADAGNHRILKIATDNTVATVAGNGTSCSSMPFSGIATDICMGWVSAVAVDGGGHMYFNDSFTNQVRRVDTNGNLLTVAGTGQFGFNGLAGAAIGMKLNSTSGLVVDNNGDLIISDTGNHMIRKVISP